MELMNEEKLRQKSNEVNLHKIKMLDLEIELAELELKKTRLMIQMLEEKNRQSSHKGGRRFSHKGGRR